MVYWLAKEEVAHTTKFTSLLQLSINLGADYLRELHRGGKQIIAEFIQCLSAVIKELLTSLKQSSFYALMINESTDIAVLMQLVLAARYVAVEGEDVIFECMRHLRWDS